MYSEFPFNKLLKGGFLTQGKKCEQHYFHVYVLYYIYLFFIFIFFLFFAKLILLNIIPIETLVFHWFFFKSVSFKIQTDDQTNPRIILENDMHSLKNTIYYRITGNGLEILYIIKI